MRNIRKKTALWRLLYGLLLLLAASAILLTGCYPGEIDSVEETDLVVTLFDKDANFSAYKTYAMPDTIIHICDVLSEDQSSCPAELRRTYDNLILSQIRSNLQSMGFADSSATPDSADVLVVVSANATDMYGYSYYGWYWDYWYPYGGYGWYYPPTTVYYEFTTGTLMINMFKRPDPNPNPNQQLDALWIAAINGLIGEGGNAQTRLNTTIDQAFEQSAYLGAGK